MTPDQPFNGRTRGAKLLRVGTGLIAAAAVVGMAGITVMAAAAAAAARKQFTEAHLPPTQFAKRHWHSAKSAVTAGRGAWQAEFGATPNGPDGSPAESSGTGNGGRNGTRAGAHAASRKQATA